MTEQTQPEKRIIELTDLGEETINFYSGKIEYQPIRFQAMRTFPTEKETKNGGYRFDETNEACATKIDNHYLLWRLGTWRSDGFNLPDFFGISDTLQEARTRLYETIKQEATRMAQKFEAEISDKISL